MNTQNTTSNAVKTLIAFCLVFCFSIFSTACGQSEAYHAVHDNDTLVPTEVVDGKADTVIPTETTDFDSSGQMLRFDTTDMDSIIVLENKNDINDTFGQGSTWVRHASNLGGLMITWDGADTEVWVRPRSNDLKGSWTQAQVEVNDAETHRVSFRSDLNTDSFDVFFTNPDVMSFLLIEPIAPQ